MTKQLTYAVMETNDFTSLSVRAQSTIKRAFFANKQEIKKAYNFNSDCFEKELKRLNCGKQTITEIINFIKAI